MKSAMSAAALVISRLISAVTFGGNRSQNRFVVDRQLDLQTLTSTTLRPYVRQMMSARKIATAFQAGFSGKADAEAHNPPLGCGNRGTAS